MGQLALNIHNIHLGAFDRGYCYAAEKLTRNLLRKKISICDIKDDCNRTVLHSSFASTEDLKLFLQIAGDDTWKLLTTQTKFPSNRSSEKCFFQKWSIFGQTPLHFATEQNFYLASIKLLLDAVGDNVSTLLFMQNDCKETALHCAVKHNDLLDCNNIKIVRLLLDTAGDHLQDFMNILNKDGKTAFDIATPEVKAIMLPYMQNNQ